MGSLDERAARVGSVVRVEAVDWCRHLYQIKRADVDELVHVKDAIVYGLLIKWDDTMLVVAHQVFPDDEGGEYREVLAIPVGCLIRVDGMTWGEEATE